MKATGVVRRIDELGRIVIPKEIRKTLRIHEGENLEIFIDNQDNIVLKKYSALNRIEDLAQSYVDSVYAYMKHNILITDTDNIIAMSGPLKKEYLDKPISENLRNSIERRETMLEKHQKEIHLTDDTVINGTYAFSTIVCNGDAIGLVMILSTEENVTDLEERTVQIASQFLSKHLED